MTTIVEGKSNKLKGLGTRENQEKKTNHWGLSYSIKVELVGGGGGVKKSQKPTDYEYILDKMKVLRYV